MATATPCQHCQRVIVWDGARWVDPEATGDDSIYRESCADHDTFEAPHEPKPCGWRCGDTEPDHKHYRIIVREDGKLLGGLTPDGTTARNRVHQSIVSRATADRVVADINAGRNRGEDATGVLTAKAVAL